MAWAKTSMADTTDAIAALVSTLVELPLRLVRSKAQQREVLARLSALGGAGAIAPVDLVAAAPSLGKSVTTLSLPGERQQATGSGPDRPIVWRRPGGLPVDHAGAHCRTGGGGSAR